MARFWFQRVRQNAIHRAGGGSGRSRLTTRFLACRRGAVALESALACVVLVFALAGVYQIVQAVFVGDLIQRAAHRVARANALYDTAAGNPTQLRTRIAEAIKAELGELLSFELAENGTCQTKEESEPEEGEPEESEPEAVQKDFCLVVKVDVYDCPLCLKDNKLSQRANAALGGDAGDIVVVRLHLIPQTTLGKIEQQLFGTGLRATAVMRNERLEETA